jgi:hypothetical protein
VHYGTLGTHPWARPPYATELPAGDPPPTRQPPPT